MDEKLRKILRKQRTIIHISISTDRVVLLDMLVEKGVFKSRSEAIVKAIDDLLAKYQEGGDKDE